MTQEEVLSQLAARFPKVEKAAQQVKDYLTLKMPAEDFLPVVRHMKEKMGFDYLDMVTAVDEKGPVSLQGYIRDPNPNVFLPEGATPQAEPASPNPAVSYGERMVAVYALSRLSGRIKVFIKVELPRHAPRIPSLTGLYKTADWQEREVYDLLGIVFSGHPNLKKILTPDFISGHPLRKDYVHVKDRFD